MVVATGLEVAIDGVARGLSFALLGAAITLVFGLGNVLNLALGSFAVIAVVVAVAVAGAVGSVVGGAAAGIAAVALLGLAVDRTLLSSVYRSEGEERIVLGIFVTLGLAIAIDGVLFVYVPLTYSIAHGVPALELAGVAVRGSTLLTVAVAAPVLAGLFGFLDRTRLGTATRTVVHDETGALLCGVNPRRIRTLVFVLSVVLAGVAGLLRAASSDVTVAAGFELTVFAIIVAIVGGVRDLRGTVVAGLGLGVVITFANFLVGAYLANVLLFGVAVAVLVARPEEIS
ncbi:branched-chain amino acid ABC transporter permease [Halorubrum sp. JWXQ-INN 858]|uniref:branched-chain amino acid ABC transporter permease n=1 Tax=Halorubrum sp. JWXQ-INN 858 TaxID=2690782 RepID=UPI001359B14C|nr:branched-chain amino acid ABC transporter permease [Halorubrum sp. JWXQ-INN 858]MWV65547.1 branched-chain amino acid ABC transporter permease [Halorubrum sp. JWXQ-INN 858]